MTSADMEPNVVWTADTDPPAWYMDGRDAVLMPKAEAARKGFWTPDPMRLIRLSGGNLKMLVAKGGGAVKSGASRGKIKTRGNR